MKILFAASEVFPYSKTGGLGDMANFLPKALQNIGHSVTVITPYYSQVIPYHNKMTYIGTKEVSVGSIKTWVNYYSLDEDGVEIIFVQNQQYFERSHLYGFEDDALRFMVFSYAVLEYIDLMKDLPQILHVNDWQTATIPFLLDQHYRYLDKYRNIHTLLTIHNLQYQGSFGTYAADYFNIHFDYTFVHFKSINYLKTGIETATKINTVSPNYRDEIMTQEFGFSLDGSIKKRGNDVSGILNGIDQQLFNPETDPLIYKNYTTRNLKLGKQANKQDLLDYFQMEADVTKPMISFIGRLANQKGIDLMQAVLEDVLMYSNASLVVLGSGEEEYEDYFIYLKDKYPNRVGYYQGYNEALAHKIYAGSDIFLMPSKFEPCGLGQMMAMRYATIPVVRETGGLKDTVIPYNKYDNTGTGFSFFDQTPEAFKDVIYQAINLFNNEYPKWHQLVRRAMANDFSLEKMAKEYSRLYEEIIGG